MAAGAPASGAPVRVLVVDDSALMRRCLGEILAHAGGFDVHAARNGVEALDRIRALDPDVVTLDVNMPEMDGLTCLSHIMVERPRPVVMISSLTDDGAMTTLEALGMGAVDYVAKPGGTVSLTLRQVGEDIVRKVRAAARARVHGGVPRRPPAPPRPVAQAPAPVAAPAAAPHAAGRVGLVVVGVSTGGPQTLDAILPELPADFGAPVLVVQHMPATFTRALAARLAECCRLAVREVGSIQPLEPGTIAVARGDRDVVVCARGGRLAAMSVPAGSDWPWHPSVERAVRSALDHVEPSRLCGVLLTGMGNDGAHAMADLHRRGGRTIAESEESSVVFGMPRELIALGGAEAVLPADRIAARLVEWS